MVEAFKKGIGIAMVRKRRQRAVAFPVVEKVEFASNEERIESKYRERATSPLRAIRAFCVLCMGCQPKKVTSCDSVDCALHPFRQGKNPFQKHAKKNSAE